MKVIFGKYTIEPDKNNSYVLHKTIVANKVNKKTREPTGETYEKIIDLAYCSSIDRAVIRLIDDEMVDRNKEQTLSLQDFLREYRNLINEVSCYILNKE